MKKLTSPKKILVVGSPDRQEEFARLKLSNSVVEYSEEWDFSGGLPAEVDSWIPCLRVVHGCDDRKDSR